MPGNRCTVTPVTRKLLETMMQLRNGAGAVVAAFLHTSKNDRARAFGVPKGLAMICQHQGTRSLWSGRRESNPRMQLGKLPFYH